MTARGWTYAQVGELTFSQLENEWNKGKPDRPDKGRKTVAPADYKKVLADFKAGKW